MEDLYKHMIQYEHVRSVNPYKTMTTRHCQTYTYNCTVSQSVTTTDINLNEMCEQSHAFKYY